MTRAHLCDFQLIASMVVKNFDFFDFGGLNALFGILFRFIIVNSSEINVQSKIQFNYFNFNYIPSLKMTGEFNLISKSKILCKIQSIYGQLQVILRKIFQFWIIS